jgi:hypothetical protein
VVAEIDIQFQFRIEDEKKRAKALFFFAEHEAG